MNRDEFMKQLEHLLSDLPADEREEALRYYQDYFDDAGVTEEARIIEELGTPVRVAKLIKNNLYGRSSSEAGEYTESGYRNPYEEDTKNPITRTDSPRYSKYEEDTIDKDRTKTLLIVALVIVSFPIWIAIAATAFGIIVGICGTLFGLTVGFGAACLGLLVGGIVLFVMGIGQLVYFAPTGAVMIGTSFIIIALGLLFLILTMLIVGRLIPACIRGITSFCSKAYQKTRRAIA